MSVLKWPDVKIIMYSVETAANVRSYRHLIVLAAYACMQALRLKLCSLISSSVQTPSRKNAACYLSLMKGA